eukprot:gnl/Hemi2/11965_TR4088_c0_g1_i1.p1 gnl/Hemi2/11965_TR4088_c0_g1~~gnl/Hemi2/11965_TR4088_c0_g1_i1.p1  ORF type:complete len:180 (-),score=21.73 gnl/Hemi2/11965_TR4088_c0_g1_i1:223-762(-)
MTLHVLLSLIVLLAGARPVVPRALACTQCYNQDQQEDIYFCSGRVDYNYCTECRSCYYNEENDSMVSSAYATWAANVANLTSTTVASLSSGCTGAITSAVCAQYYPSCDSDPTLAYPLTCITLCNYLNTQCGSSLDCSDSSLWEQNPGDCTAGPDNANSGSMLAPLGAVIALTLAGLLL